MATAEQGVAIGEDAPIFEVMSTMRAMRRLKPDPIPNVQSIVDDQEWLIAHGFLSQRVNVPDFLDLSMIEEAIRQLGSARR